MTSTDATIGHSDRPLDSLSQDSLGLSRDAQSLATFVRGCDTPFTVAIQGDWGTGKTSLMNMVRGLLTQAPLGREHGPVETIWFPTWQYSQFGSMEALPVALLSSLLRCLSGDPGVGERALQMLGRLVRPVASVAVRTASHGNLELGDMDGLTARRALDSAANADALKREISEVVAAKLKRASRIVVFIDDLDRIKPTIAVEILETIKLFLDWQGCVFVLALDYGVVSRGLSDKFGIGEAELGRSFFDKIIQLPFSIPVARYRVDKYIGTLFEAMQLPMATVDEELFSELVKLSVSTNPRGIKRVFNSLVLLIEMAQAKADRLAIRILFAVLCLQFSYESVYAWLLDRGDRLTAADLLALGGACEDGAEDGLAGAIGRLTDERRDTFGRFGRTFLESVQDPDSGDQIDAKELARIKGLLSLSRVTAVSERPVTVPTDPEFRSRNREIMARVRADLERRLASDIEATGRGFWTNTAHQLPNVWIKRNATPDGSLNLVLNHGVDEVLLYVEGGKRALRTHAALLRSVLEPIASPFEDHGDEGVRFLRRAIAPDLSIEARESLLMNEVTDRLLQAHRLLKDRLWR